MAKLSISRSAKSDLLKIAAFTREKWGADQAARYLNSLEDCARMLAENPSIGRSCEYVRTGLRRFEKGSQVIFYRQTDDGIFISRMLHRSMLPERHSIGSGDPDS
jgi:toxin ParE1/3/4